MNKSENCHINFDDYSFALSSFSVRIFMTTFCIIGGYSYFTMVTLSTIFHLKCVTL